MKLKEIDELYIINEEDMRIINKNKMLELLKNFYYLCKKNNLEYYSSNNIWDSFYINYNNLVDKGLYNDIKMFMNNKDANEIAFIYEYLHSIDGDNKNIKINNKLFKFENAKKYFDNTNLEKIFSKKLKGECFDRTLDIVSMLPGSRAIVTYLPNLFEGGYYHAYVKCSDNTIIDPASNMIIKDDFTKELLNGKEIISMNYNEIKNAYQELLLSIDGIEEYDRPLLLKLALYEELKSLLTNKRMK